MHLSLIVATVEALELESFVAIRFPALTRRLQRPCIRIVQFNITESNGASLALWLDSNY